MFVYPAFKEIRDFKWKDLHKKVGRIIYQEPTESDIAEGHFKTKVWFIDEELNWYLLEEK